MATYSEVLERVMRGDYAEATEEQRDEAVRKVINACAVAAAAVTVQPMPFVDTALIAPIQIAMVQAIGRIRGHSLDTKSVVEILSTLGVSIVAQNLIMAAAKFVPFLGFAVTLSMAYALTFAIGDVSDRYFRSGRRASASELRDLFDKVYRRKRAEKARPQAGLRTRLDQLTQAFEAGLIDEAEFTRKKEDLLRDF